MQRWWDSADAARDALGRVDDSDVQMGVGTALLGYHAIAKEALEPLASQTLVDPSVIEAYLDGIDLEPVAKAISAAARGALPQAEADRYGWLMATDTHHRALAATPRLATALVAKGTSWPKAVERVVAVVGVPLERLGRYPETVSKASVDSLSLSDAADRSLMTWAAAISGSVPLETVSKRSRERERGHEPEKEKFDESEVKRDEKGRFAEEADHQQRLAREARKRRKARRQRRQAASQAAEKPQQAKAKDRAQSKVKARAMGKARPVTQAQARALVASSARKRPQALLELDEARRAEEMDLPDDTGAFGLKKKGTHYTIWDDSSLGTDYYPTYTTTPVDPGEAQPVMDANDLLKALGGPEAFNGKETFTWDRTAGMGILGFDDDTPIDEVEAGLASLPPVTLADYDPNQHIRNVSMSAIDLANFDQFFVHAPGALPMRSVYDSPVGDHLVRRTATLAELPAGSTWETSDESVLSTSIASTNWVDQDGRPHHIVFDFPSIKQSHTANGVKKAERTRTRERPHANAPERWDETQVKRDEQGQFAAEGTAEQKQAVEDRAARKRRRNKRRARQAAFAEAKAQTKAKERPKEKARERVRGKARAYVSGKARVRGQQLARGRSLSQVESRTPLNDEYPLGLTMHKRELAPSTGPYTLDEPLYTMQVADGSTPQLAMTEDEMTQTLRAKLTVATRSTQKTSKYGEQIETWAQPGGHSHSPTVRRYEPGTLPIGGRNPQGRFYTASDEQIAQQWESAPFSGEGPSEIDFIVAAPGDQFDRRPKTVKVNVEYVFTSFTKADVAKAKERERSAQNAPERWDETKVKRDEQGQFAAEQSDEAKAARERRKRRKVRRAKRAARAQAWKERNAPPQAKARERVQGTARSRALGLARERATAAVKSAERLRPARGRAMSKVAEQVLGTAEPTSWDDALIAPWKTELGKFLGQAGIQPWVASMPMSRLELSAPYTEDQLFSGVSVEMEDMFKEMGSSNQVTHNDFVHGFNTVIRPIARTINDQRDALLANDPATPPMDDIETTTRKLLSNAIETWKPAQASKGGVLTTKDDDYIAREKPSYDEVLSLHANGDVTFDSIADPNAPIPTFGLGRPTSEPIVGKPNSSFKHMDPAPPAQPVVIGNQAAVAIRQIDAMMRVGSNELSDAERKAAGEGWRRVHGRNGTVITEADKDQIIDTVQTLVREAHLVIHPIPDKALIETAGFAMSKQKTAAVRLDNRAVFLITSNLDQANGWDRLAEKRATPKEKR